MNSEFDRSGADPALPATEVRDPALAGIDRLSIAERCALQNRLDGEVAGAVARCIPQIAGAVERIVQSLRAGGRLIYVGAGTSGRLGVLDAAECPPTFGTDPDRIQAIIAGGPRALVDAVEGAEDDREGGAAEILKLAPTARDTVVGIAASGRTPYVLGALEAAAAAGAAAIGVTNNEPSEIAAITDPTIAVVVGPELIAGSTRLRAGTAQKMVLNMLTTQAMIEIGKTYGNAMVDVAVTNSKLRSRALRLIREICGVDESAAAGALTASQGSVKVAIVMLMRGVDAAVAAGRLDCVGGSLRKVLEDAR